MRLRLRSLVLVVAALSSVAGGSIGARLAPAAPVLGTVVLDGGPAEPAAVVGRWTVARAVPQPARRTHATSFLAADAVVPSVPLYTAPGRVLEGGRTMANPTREGLALVFLVKERRGQWLDVQVSARPNGMRAWVRAADVRLRTVPNWIRVELGTRRITVFHGDTPLFATTVAVGKPASPTPTGVFFVDGAVRLVPDDGPYGAGQLSVSGFSDVYQRFGGGIGQIALHGTNAPGLIGQPASNGCVRLTNPDLRRVMALAPTGTPVEIVP